MQSVQKCAKMVCKNMEACHARALRWCAAKGKLLTRRSMIATCMTSRGLRPAVAQRRSGIHGAAASHALEGPLSLGGQIVPQYHFEPGQTQKTELVASGPVPDFHCKPHHVMLWL